MEKFIKEHRKLFGDFEVIDFVDEEVVKTLRDQIDIECPVELHWSWDYAQEIAEIRSLYEKGKVNQWNAETDLDWEIPVSKDEWLVHPEVSLFAQATKHMGKDEATQKAAMFDEYSYLLSQLLHGEQAALQLCGQLTNLCVSMDEKTYSASQVTDEARHVEAFAKFIQRKLGTIYPIGGTLKILLDTLLGAPTVQLKTLGMQVLFEGTAMGIMDLMRQESRNPLLAETLGRVARDEARHAAFGVLMMRRIVGEAEPEQRDEMEDWAFGILEALNANQQMDMLRVLGPKYGVDAEITTKMFLASEGFADFNSRIYMHTVIPNLRNLGLITERTEDHWRKVGMMVDKRAA